MNFTHAMIAPALVTAGMGVLLLSRGLSIVEAGYAAPAVPPRGAEPGAVSRAAGKPADPAAKPGTLSVGAAGEPSPEFGDVAPKKTIRPTSDHDLGLKGMAVAGREDPFMALIPPALARIAPPPISLPPLRPPAGFRLPIPGRPLPPGPGPAANPLPGVPTQAPATGGKPAAPGVPGAVPSPGLAPWVAPAAPPEPAWTVRGVVSTGAARMIMLEGKDEHIQAMVGDLLPDGSRVEAISSRGVTLLREGRRYVKQIGGAP